MSKGTARLGDRTSGICSIHGGQGGTITGASSNVIVNNKGVARLGDSVVADCGHTATIVAASGDTIGNSKGVARLGDSVGGGVYTATIVTASGNTGTN